MNNWYIILLVLIITIWIILLQWINKNRYWNLIVLSINLLIFSIYFIYIKDLWFNFYILLSTWITYFIINYITLIKNKYKYLSILLLPIIFMGTIMFEIGNINWYSIIDNLEGKWCECKWLEIRRTQNYEFDKEKRIIQYSCIGRINKKNCLQE